MVEPFKYEKPLDKSLLKYGFNIPVELHLILSKHLSRGYLEHGEKREAKFFLEGREYDVVLRSIGFDRKEYPTHGEIWQFNYGAKSPIACRLREIFSSVLSTMPAPFNAKLIVRSTGICDIFRLDPVINIQALDKFLQIYFLDIKEEPHIEGHNGRINEIGGGGGRQEIFFRQILF